MIKLQDQRVIQPIGIPQGTPQFEEKRATLIRTFWNNVPKEYYLPSEMIENPPVNVSNIPGTCGILTGEEVEITEKYDCTGLAEAIATRRYTAVTVAKAFSKRAIICHQLTCCLTQWFMDTAIARAQELDDYLEKNGTTIGPLHGVPISIKEHIPIAGTYSSQGCFGSSVLNEKDCQMVAILRSLGAVFYCKTNQPQSIMHLESTSHWGRVLNPYNINLSAGGSTGGEAALVAMHGSPMGVGTDIGGSVRGPSAFCGIYGFKPTTYTLPMRDFLSTPFPAELNILCSTGPMCRTLRDTDLFMRLILAARPHLTDPRLIPIPWTGLSTPVNKKLKVGIIEHDGFILPQPPVRRAISWAKKALSRPELSGIVEIKPFAPYKAKEAWSLIQRMYWPDAAKVTIDAITSTGEPIHPLSSWIWREAEAEGMQDAVQIIKARAQRNAFRCAFAESWTAQDVDIVLGPAFVGPACKHDTAFYWTYTSLWNFVDYPGCVVPTPISVEAGETYPEGYQPLSDECWDVKRMWDKGGFEGAPIALQINARRHADNDLFGAMKILKEALELM